MQIISWVLLILLSPIVGVLYVNYLTVHPLKMSRYLLGTCLVFFVLLIVLAVSFQGVGWLFAAFLSGTLVILGYAIMTHILLSKEDPRPAEVIEEFVRKGIEKVLYFSAAISAEAIHSQVDVPELCKRANVPEGFPLINLGAWNDDPIVIRAIKEKIDI